MAIHCNRFGSDHKSNRFGSGHKKLPAGLTRTSGVPRRFVSRRRSAFTLVEVLIATAVTLLMMVSLAQIFSVIGESMKQGRAALELNGRLRGVTHRIRNDLNNLTVIPRPPLDPSSGLGYLKLFDGSCDDYTAARVSSTLDPSRPAALSRFGDVDDILLGTVRAGDTWFTGRVPKFILTAAQNGLAPSASEPEDFAFVTIAAQYAEVVAFLQPLVDGTGNPSRDPSVSFNVSPQGWTATSYQDLDEPRNTATGGPNGFPDAFRLHYRTLLIRPDLNLQTGLSVGDLGVTAPAGVLCPANNGSTNWLVAQEQRSPDGTVRLPSPLCDMTASHQQCDLSMRRVRGSTAGMNVPFEFVAANSLEDLVDPANRFAHVQVPVPGAGGLLTMPLLALGPRLEGINSLDPNGLLGGNTFLVGSGFLHPAFTLYGSRAGEDVLASDILAFDIKGFDPSAPLLPTPGADGNNDFGAAGSDDLVLNPSDPGYALNLGAVPIALGDYVDIGWAHKIRQHLVLHPTNSTTAIPANANLYSHLSGYSLENATANQGLPYTDALYKSGLINQTGALPGTLPQILQLAYDTWTRRYEGDGILQAERSGRGATYGNPSIAPRETWRNGVIDAGSDGLDNNALTGIDEAAEQETAPPFPFALQGVQITIRMEDPATRLIDEMQVVKEFVTQ